jgi:hypothetical protein
MSGDHTGAALAARGPEVEHDREAERQEGLRVAQRVALDERIAANARQQHGDNRRPGEPRAALLQQPLAHGEGDDGDTPYGEK